MIRRFLCLGVVLLILLSAGACGEGKAPNKPPPVADPEGNAKPKASSSKAG